MPGATGRALLKKKSAVMAPPTVSLKLSSSNVTVSFLESSVTDSLIVGNFACSTSS